MDINTAVDTVEALANGTDPVTGEMFPDDSPYNQPEVIRALFATLELVKTRKKPKKSPEEKQQDNIARGLPKNAGFPWTEEERTQLAEKFTSGTSIRKLTELHQRTRNAINAELKKQGLIEDTRDV